MVNYIKYPIDIHRKVRTSVIGILPVNNVVTMSNVINEGKKIRAKYEASGNSVIQVENIRIKDIVKSEWEFRIEIILQ